MDLEKFKLLSIPEQKTVYEGLLKKRENFNELMAYRCIEDVKINWKLWKDLETKLMKLYGSTEEMFKLIDYLSFKMDCAREAEEVGVKLDVERAQKNYDELDRMQEEKFLELVKAMPKQPVYKTFKKPAQQFKKDVPSFSSSLGVRWLGWNEPHGQGRHSWGSS